MDTHLKERLVGAAVLVAAAVILIPEMLSGPGERPAPPDADRAADSGVRTYTIDLANPGQSSGGEAQAARAEPAVVEEPVPPPEVIEPAPQENTPEPATVAETAPVAEPSAPVAVPSPPSPSSPPPAPAVSQPQAPRNLPWAVQVGSFASQATADRLKNDLAGRGFQSYVVPFKTSNQTLYRVRIGPMQERSAADAAVQKLKAQGTNATVVSNS